MTSRNSKEVNPERIPTEDNAACLYCKKHGSADVNWVQCKACEEWAHFSCAGVDGSIADVDWHCPRCFAIANQQLNVPKGKSRSSKSKAGSKGESGSVRGNGSVSDLTDQQFEEEQLARERAFEKQMQIREQRLRREMEWNAKQLEMERKLREMELNMQRKMQEDKLKQEQELLENQLASEKAFLVQRDAIRSQMNRSLQKVQSIMDEEGAVGGVLEEPNKKVKSWLNDQDQFQTPLAIDKRGAYKKGEKPKGAQKADPRIEASRSLAGKIPSVYDNAADEDDEDASEEEDAVALGNVRDADRWSHIPSEAGGYLHGPGNQIFRLTREQIATRKVVSKTLPKFSGEPEAWPLFISSFEHTTRACGYSNIENLDRLLNSLEGEALNAVRSMLVLPDSVPEVIRDLRRLFGQPERLLRTLLNKVKNALPPTTENLKSFVSYGITVKQLCDHLEAARLHEHLHNPLMVQQLVEKLPPEYQMKWVEYRRGKQGTPLRLFTDYITGVGDIASEAVAYHSATKEPVRNVKLKPTKKKEFVHVHDSSSTHPEGASNGKPSKPCWICKRTDHRIRYCDDFRKMNIAERLRAVGKEKLCGVCLNRHGDNPCGSKLRCTVKSCKGNHHPLLHRVEESVQLQKVECNTREDAKRSVIFRMVPVTLLADNDQTIYSLWQHCTEETTSMTVVVV